MYTKHIVKAPHGLRVETKTRANLTTGNVTIKAYVYRDSELLEIAERVIVNPSTNGDVARRRSRFIDSLLNATRLPTRSAQ